MTYEIVFDDETNFRIYLVKRSDSHHKNGYKSVSCERIEPENLPKKTLLKLVTKGVTEIPKEVLP